MTTVNPIDSTGAFPPPPPILVLCPPTSDGGFTSQAWQAWFAQLASAVSTASNTVSIGITSQFPVGITPVSALPATGAFDGQTVYLTVASGGNAVGLYTWDAAVNAWLSAVNPQSTWILQGVQQLSSTGGLLVGNVTWNPTTGVVTGGTGGVVITKNGIAGFNGTSTTFAIDTHGNAQFGGTLVGAIVTATNINVATLAAINANMGTITAGKIQTGTSGSYMVIDANNNDIEFFESGVNTVLIQGQANLGPLCSLNVIDNILSSALFCTSSSANGLSTVGTFNGETGFAGTVVTVNANSSSSGSGLAVTGNSTASAVTITNHGHVALTIDGGLFMTNSAGNGANMANVFPLVTNTYNLGSASLDWANIYSQNALTVVSDRRWKRQIKDSDLGLAFIRNLRPRSYVQKDGKRLHYGFIAQEVKEALGSVDAAIWTSADVNDRLAKQALRYEEIIAPLVKAVQELDAQVQGLKKLVNVT